MKKQKQKKRKSLQERIDWLFQTQKAKKFFEEERWWAMGTRNEIWKTYKDWNDWKELADRVFSEYVRLYYSDDKGVCECITCWRKFPWRTIQNWHFITRWNLRYRYDITNCHPQCLYCNVMLHWSYQRYTIRMIDLYWKEKVLSMMNDRRCFKITQEQYEKSIFQLHNAVRSWKGELIRTK